MRKTILVSSILLVLSWLTGCSNTSSAAELQKIVANSQKQLETIGAVISVTTPDSSVYSEVTDAKATRFVNSAVFNKEGVLTHISRKLPSDVLSLRAGFAIATGKVGSTFDFAGSTFKFKSVEVTIKNDHYTVSFKVLDTTGTMGTFSSSADFKFQDDLITAITLNKNLYNKDNPEEVCYYYPAGCSLSSVIDYSQVSVSKAMTKAIKAYEKSQLHDPQSVTNFEDIMQQMNETYNQYLSWTTTNSDQSAGIIYSSAKDEGVRWDSYGDPAIKFSADSISSTNNGPDLGFVSGLFFDTTDGGSTFFYDKVIKTNANSYDILSSDGTVAGSLNFTNGLLTSFMDNTIGFKDKYQVNPLADLVLLSKKGS